MTGSDWTVNEQEYLEAPGLSALVFHDFYPEGKQGGVEIIQHGQRVATNGDLRLEPAPEQWALLPKVGTREADPKAGIVRVPLSYPDHKLDYTIRVAADGASLRFCVDLARPLPTDLVGRAALTLELFPGTYIGKTFQLGAAFGVFPAQANGPMQPGEDGQLRPVPMATGPDLVVAPEDPLCRMTIECLGGELELLDGRNTAQNGWFVVRSLVPAGRAASAVEWRITPNRVEGWRRDPVIGVSQVGYHPNQVKRAIIELDPRCEPAGHAKLWRLDPERGPQMAFPAPLQDWGRFLRYRYVVFEFTPVREPGVYYVRYEGWSSSPFQISGDVFRNGIWQPTLETFLPVQMCHMEIRDRYRVWHGACHLDDALQAPAPHVHFDGYQQGPATETPFAPHQHIPQLDRGGWHDAGDYDLAAGSQANTTLTLALIREAFGIDWDQTTVRRDERLVLLHTPDGVPDIVQQVAHGAENLLGGYRAAGHSFSGIICSTLRQYVHLGDAATMTDNRVYDPSVASDKMDDRWAFTSRDTSLEYKVAAALAAASRVLRGFEDGLASECLEAVTRAWDYEQTHPPVSQPSAYVPGSPQTQEFLAAAELLITTGDARYRQRLLAQWPALRGRVEQVGWAAARALPHTRDEAFARDLREALAGYGKRLDAELAKTPYRVPYRPHIWGIAWDIQHFAVKHYFLAKAFPELFDGEPVLSVLNFVLGCHPDNDLSLVSGVGARSLTVAYGTNRDDHSYIPGGVASGPNLIRPDFPELKSNFPYLWQQAEYVIHGAATFLFCVLAADELLNGKP